MVAAAAQLRQVRPRLMVAGGSLGASQLISLVTSTEEQSCNPRRFISSGISNKQQPRHGDPEVSHLSSTYIYIIYSLCLHLACFATENRETIPIFTNLLPQDNIAAYLDYNVNVNALL